MQTSIADKYRNRPFYSEAEEILRRCVHCGFCNATCPTFQLLGDELDGPRGRVYLVKQILEGTAPTSSSRKHLDRCLTCLSCETTCPSGVQYNRLLHIGRELHNEVLPRPLWQKWQRLLLRWLLLRPGLFRSLLRLAHVFAWLLPASLRAKLPPLQSGHAVPAGKTINTDESNTKTLLMLRGCAQRACAPGINGAASSLFNQLGYSIVESSIDTCCGALSQHNDAHQEARKLARKNIDAWWPLIEKGAPGIVITASGCATMVREYGHLLAADEQYAEKAVKIASLCRDPVEILEVHADRLVRKPGVPERIAYQAPCSQQHGLQIRGRVEKILTAGGFTLTRQSIAHLCCGSAGSYSVLQPEISTQLKNNKLDDLLSERPQLVATANIGCLLHLQSGTDIPVRHWCEIMDVKQSQSLI